MSVRNNVFSSLDVFILKRATKLPHDAQVADLVLCVYRSGDIQVALCILLL
ncbi:hypothetical protein DPMN_033849 [Dreissena polymorpha]|uniref:Uncharacterized protein n=1 Tax=Dreissena polymorpha TaxID=45954 RepID=A0A9D4RLI6_DREPO|nr:hypothetical protein DPMN_033849 [Dreissena polymorpha]